MLVLVIKKNQTVPAGQLEEIKCLCFLSAEMDFFSVNYEFRGYQDVTSLGEGG